MKFKRQHFLTYLFLCIVFSQCVEPFEIGSSTFEDLLVIEGRITNENTFHKIKLSRTFPVDTSFVANPEKNARVSIIENSNIVHSFSESDDGLYISDNSFEAKPNSVYTLNIETQDGQTYASEEETLTERSEIDDVSYSVSKDDTSEQDIVVISVNGSSANGKYFFYEYEETFKIVSEFWSMYTLDTSVYPPLAVVKDNPEDSRICYSTTTSNSIIQFNTTLLSDNQVSKFPIRTISTANFMLKNRYSILVKQYIQSLNAYNYYETLNKFSSSENVFTQSQVNFIRGNITANDNSDQKVIGYFEVNSVAKKRIFLNNEDVVTTPNFIRNCTGPKIFLKFDGQIRPLFQAISGNYIFFGFADIPAVDPAIENNDYEFEMVEKSCGDCRVFGSPVKPDFWID